MYVCSALTAWLTTEGAKVGQKTAQQAQERFEKDEMERQLEAVKQCRPGRHEVTMMMSYAHGELQQKLVAKAMVEVGEVRKQGMAPKEAERDLDGWLNSVLWAYENQ